MAHSALAALPNDNKWTERDSQDQSEHLRALAASCEIVYLSDYDYPSRRTAKDSWIEPSIEVFAPKKTSRHTNNIIHLSSIKSACPPSPLLKSWAKTSVEICDKKEKEIVIDLEDQQDDCSTFFRYLLRKKSLQFEDWEKVVLTNVYHQMKQICQTLHDYKETDLAVFYEERCNTLRHLWRKMNGRGTDQTSSATPPHVYNMRENGTDRAAYLKAYEQLLKIFPKTVRILKQVLRFCATLAEKIFGKPDVANPFGLGNGSHTQVGYLPHAMWRILQRRSKVETGPSDAECKYRKDKSIQRDAYNAMMRNFLRLSRD